MSNSNSNTLAQLFLSHFLNISDKFKLIKIRLERQSDIKRFVKSILESCSLSTDKIDEIKITKASSRANTRPHSAEEFYAQDASIFEEYEVYSRTARRARQERTLEYVQHIRKSKTINY